MRIIPHGRLFVSRLLALASSVQNLKDIIVLDDGCRSDLRFWASLCEEWNGVQNYVSPSEAHHLAMPCVPPNDSGLSTSKALEDLLYSASKYMRLGLAKSTIKAYDSAWSLFPSLFKNRRCHNCGSPSAYLNPEIPGPLVIFCIPALRQAS
ncbi:hypothetical protein NQZ68_033814 [Dissostichus eleginoides]|nr:hypothetical protein NQZ68_033814 [Dissostichus eleginoides]